MSDKNQDSFCEDTFYITKEKLYKLIGGRIDHFVTCSLEKIDTEMISKYGALVFLYIDYGVGAKVMEELTSNIIDARENVSLKNCQTVKILHIPCINLVMYHLDVMYINDTQLIIHEKAHELFNVLFNSELHWAKLVIEYMKYILPMIHEYFEKMYPEVYEDRRKKNLIMC
jgi:hypothetical protein